MKVRIEGRLGQGKQAWAVQWDGHNIDEVSELAGTVMEHDGQMITIPDDDGVAPLLPGDWIIKPDEHPWLVSCFDTMFPLLFKVVDDEVA